MPLKSLTMKILVMLLTFLLGIGVSRLSINHQRAKIVSLTNPTDKNMLIFEGTVLKIGPAVPASGFYAFYRLAKYRVERVSDGYYQPSEIVVDHLSLTTHELDGLKEGDRVCVVASRSRPAMVRYKVDGIREENEKAEMFYIGDVNPRACYP